MESTGQIPTGTDTAGTEPSTGPGAHEITPRPRPRAPNCIVPWSAVVGITDRDTISLDPFATDLDAATTPRIAVMARQRGLWLQFDALFGWPADAGDWDVQEALARGLTASPDGSLTDVLAAAYPDGLGHGYEVEAQFLRIGPDYPETSRAKYDFESPEARRVIEEHLAELDAFKLSEPNTAFAAAWIALAEISRWRFGHILRAQAEVPVAAVGSLLIGIHEADLDLVTGDDEPLDFSPKVTYVAGSFAPPIK